MRRGDVRARVWEHQAKSQESAVERCVLSRVWFLESLKSVAPRCMQAESVIDAKGRTVGVFTSTPGQSCALTTWGANSGCLWSAMREYRWISPT